MGGGGHSFSLLEWENRWDRQQEHLDLWQGGADSRWPNPMAPGGVWIAPLKVSADGTTYAGTNNDRNRPKITGVYVKDD